MNGLKAAGAAVREAFDAMVAAAVPGVTTFELDQIGAAILADRGA